MDQRKKNLVAEKYAASMNQFVSPSTKPQYSVMLNNPLSDLKKTCKVFTNGGICGESIASNITDSNSDVEPKLQCPPFTGIRPLCSWRCG